jgi:hypothetical protein
MQKISDQPKDLETLVKMLLCIAQEQPCTKEKLVERFVVP